jgi:hypothetical protein
MGGYALDFCGTEVPWVDLDNNLASLDVDTLFIDTLS